MDANGDHHLPYWEPGSSHCGKTLGQNSNNMITSSLDFFLAWIDTIPIKQDGIFTIADYGTNDGYSSMPLICAIIQQLKAKHGAQFPVQVIYEDQEKNDFNSLFNTLSGEDSFMSRFPNVYAMATNSGFYKQCIPDSTCDIIFTSMTTHWLDKCDMQLKNAVFPFFGTKEEHEKFCRQAERDWNKFLTLRAKELKPGGLLFAINMCSRDACKEEKTTSMTSNGKQAIPSFRTFTHSDVYRDLQRAWVILKQKGHITQEEFEKCTFPVILRSGEETKRPFEDKRSTVHQSGLGLLQYDEQVYTCAYKTLCQEKNKPDGKIERTAFADSIATAHQVWSRYTFHSSLSDMRTEEDKAAIMETLYRTVSSLVLAVDPQSYQSSHLVSRIVAKKHDPSGGSCQN